MVKVVVARCDYPGCDEIVHEWVWKLGDNMEGKDFCENHRS